MRDGDILILKGHEVATLLEGRETELIQTVRHAYEAHAANRTSLPHSTFLRFPDQPRDRIIALPAYLDAGIGVAGIKWIASFPGNLEKGLDRASAVVILNSTETGRPEAILEGSIISAKRTAASAALAAQVLRADEGDSATIVGCGLINFEIVRFLLAGCPQIKRLFIFDLDSARAQQFKQRCSDTFSLEQVEVVTDLQAALNSSTLISMATTAIKPHISDLSGCSPATTILHVSLRDLTPELILSCDNVVDDLDHVCRAETSIHLAEKLSGDRDFVRCSLADILQGRAANRRDDQSLTVFSPFGLGILDMAVGDLARQRGLEKGMGITIDSFLPGS
ncbi:MAG: 2,3-diaminopropionate biosynthesis protein SbnB [Pyrinomonadaceae bacterium]